MSATDRAIQPMERLIQEYRRLVWICEVRQHTIRQTRARKYIDLKMDHQLQTLNTLGQENKIVFLMLRLLEVNWL